MAAERRAADAIVAALLALCVSPAWACRCAPQTLAEYFQRAGVVMQVRVEQVEIMGNGVGDGDGHAHRRAQFTRLQDYKNAAGVDSLRTALDGAACGLALQPGARYWIFGTLAPGSTQVRTGSCDGSRPIDQGFTDVAADAVHEVLLEQRRALDCPSPAPAQRPPRIAKLLIDREREEQIELRLHGVAAAASAQWVNEKLVLVRVPWSRHLRSEVLIDVERAAILSVDSARLDETGRVQHWLDADCRRQP